MAKGDTHSMDPHDPQHSWERKRDSSEFRYVACRDCDRVVHDFDPAFEECWQRAVSGDDRLLYQRRDFPAWTEEEVGGAFDGFSVSSDGDPGL